MKCMTDITIEHGVDRAETDVCSEFKNEHAAQFSSVFRDKQIDVHGTGIDDMSLVDTVTCCGAVVQTSMVVCSDEHGAKWLIFTSLDQAPVNNSCPEAKPKAQLCLSVRIPCHRTFKPFPILDYLLFTHLPLTPKPAMCTCLDEQMML